MKFSTVFNLIIFLFFLNTAINGQANLQKNISLEVNNQRLDNVLEILSNKGDFYFSYNSSIIKKDSLVSFRASNKTVKEILSLLFNTTYEFRESGNYIIIRKAPIRMTLVTQKGVTEEKIYSVSGYVYDEQSGAAINEASIYEKTILASAMSNEEGYFKIRLKSGKSGTAELTVSKEFYEDTTVKIQPRFNQQVSITMMPIELPGSTEVITPEDYLTPDSLKVHTDTTQTASSSVIADSIKVQQTGVGRFLISGKQKIQSLNLKNFFATRPFQFSVVPGLSTHGQLSSQVVNNFSLNIFGGYTAGTNGLEIGGLFNIDKREVKYFQAAGLFNSVGGEVKGVQLAGINNFVQDSVEGMQAAGINNFVTGKMSGFQVAGIYNHVSDSVKGAQIAGVGNFSKEKVSGGQIAGVSNISNREMNGVQIAGVINYAKKLRGVQIGLINIADTSAGYSIGLINIIIKGYHKLSFSANEIQNFSAAFKTGNSRLYSILQAGMNASDSNKVYSFGYGLGSELALNKKKTFSINPELSCQYLYLGSWDYTNLLNRFNLNFNVKLGKYVSLFAGPSYSVYVTNQDFGFDGYRFPVPPSGYNTTKFSSKVSGWFGWNAGINFF
ncbi:MAG TPA: STN and carboxypeptidase regulatory-like domain-containing protein [Chitinophagaceae bacterium]|nr:STN and carboxypeptidase regulatory-like domain-containing protein [Chitinophagaceae bacterium]